MLLEKVRTVHCMYCNTYSYLLDHVLVAYISGMLFIFSKICYVKLNIHLILGLQ